MKVGKYFGYGSLVIVGLAVILLLYWLYSPPEHALTITPDPIAVRNKQVKRGQFAVLQYRVCKNVSTDGRVTATLEGEGRRILLPVGTESSAKGCQDASGTPLQIPEDTNPGMYKFTFRVTYVVNPFVTLVEDYETVTFDVVE